MHACRSKRAELEKLAHNWALSTAGLTVPQIRDILYQADAALQDLGWIESQPLPHPKQWHPAVPGHDVPKSPESDEPRPKQKSAAGSPDEPRPKQKSAAGCPASMERPGAKGTACCAGGGPMPSSAGPEDGAAACSRAEGAPATPKPPQRGRARQGQGLSLGELWRQAEADARQALPDSASEAEVAARAAKIIPHLVQSQADTVDFCSPRSA
jgi:hypothetical protein